MTTSTAPSLADAVRDVVRTHRIAVQHDDVGAVTCGHDHHGLAMYSTTEYAEHLNAEILHAVEVHVRQQRDAFLTSPGLDPAWVAGWHSAIEHVAHHIAQAVTSRP